MSYNLDGCFELSGGKYRPKYTDPCGGADITSCLELSGGKYVPFKELIGSQECEPDSTCITSGGVPRLTFDSYANEAALIAACCGFYPKYIQLTIDGVLNEDGNPHDCNATVVCGQGASPCSYEYSDTTGDGGARCFLYDVRINPASSAANFVRVRAYSNAGCTCTLVPTAKTCFEWHASSGTCHYEGTNEPSQLEFPAACVTYPSCCGYAGTATWSISGAVEGDECVGCSLP